MSFWLNVLGVIKGGHGEDKQESKIDKEVDLVKQKKELKDKVFATIDEGAEPYNLRRGLLENNINHNQEIKRIKETFEYYKKGLSKIFSDVEIQIMKNQAYERADLRLTYREKKGNLSRQDMGRLLELESQINPDGGQKVLAIAQASESRKSLNEFDRIALSGTPQQVGINKNASRGENRTSRPELSYQSK